MDAFEISPRKACSLHPNKDDKKLKKSNFKFICDCDLDALKSFYKSHLRSNVPYVLHSVAKDKIAKDESDKRSYYVPTSKTEGKSLFPFGSGSPRFKETVHISPNPTRYILKSEASTRLPHAFKRASNNRFMMYNTLGPGAYGMVKDPKEGEVETHKIINAPRFKVKHSSYYMPGKYDTRRCLKLMDEHGKKYKGKFSSAKQLPDKPFDRVFWHCPQNVPPLCRLKLGPGEYDFADGIGTKSNQRSIHPFDTSTNRMQMTKIIRSYTSHGGFHGPGRYRIKRFCSENVPPTHYIRPN